LKPDLREKQARLATLLQERGPRITEIARKLDESPETVRYWFKHNILGRRGVAYQAVPNYEGLGFKRIHAVIDFADEYLPHAKEILISMNSFCYLTNYFRTFPSGYYVILLTVPTEFERHYRRLLSDMQEIGIFRLLQVDGLDWVRVAPMKTKYFDFGTGKWDFDWSEIVTEKKSVTSGLNPRGAVKFDREDLLILQKLQVDATKSLGKISRELKMPYPQVYNHFNHITETGQVLLYKIMWPATGPRSQEDLKAWQQQHAYMGLQFIVRSSTESEQRELLTKLERLPFILSTGAGEGTFHAEFVIPLEYYSETFQYLAQALLDSRGRTEFFIGDQINALAFTVPTRLYNKEAEAWTNNADEALSKFKNLVLTLNGS
jgi:DNA-binding Lrp family transcriptional regulator